MHDATAEEFIGTVARHAGGTDGLATRPDRAARVAVDGSPRDRDVGGTP